MLLHPPSLRPPTFLLPAPGPAVAAHTPECAKLRAASRNDSAAPYNLTAFLPSLYYINYRI
eukprot:3510286-Prymnesium_polylepis.2